MANASKSKSFMDIALEEAQLAASLGEVPVGAVIVHDGKIIARGGNRTRSENDPTGHAETIVIRKAAQLLSQHKLGDCDLYVTLEPCSMCAGAISHARLRRLYFGATDEKGGAVISGVKFFNDKTCHHAPEIYSGIGATKSSQMLKSFFDAKRKTAKGG